MTPTESTNAEIIGTPMAELESERESRSSRAKVVIFTARPPSTSETFIHSSVSQTDDLVYDTMSFRDTRSYVPVFRDAIIGRTSKVMKRHLDGQQLVHAHYWQNALLCERSARELGIPLVVTCHGADVARRPLASMRRGIGGSLVLRRRRFFAGFEGTILAPSQLLADYISSTFDPQVEPIVHYTGVRLDPIKDALRYDKDDGLVGFVGRLVPKKGIKDMVRAMLHVLAARPDVRLEVVGDGPLSADIKRLVETFPDRVIWWGARDHDEALSVIRRAAVLVMPSRPASDGDFESFGMVAAEAQLLSTPVVGYMGGALSESVGLQANLVESADVTSLAHVTLSLLEDSALLKRQAELGRSFAAEYFDGEVQVGRLAELHRALIEEASGGA